MLDIRPEDPESPSARALIDALSEALRALTGDAGRASFDPQDLRDPDGLFVVARDARGTPVGCGGFRALPERGPRVAELKRMYAVPRARAAGAGEPAGVGHAVLVALQQAARARGHQVLCLSTRRVNARAVAFYARHGYAACAPWGRYVGRDASVCLEKRL